MEYTQITCDQDIVPFLGRVVAVKSDSYYFTGGRDEVFACVTATPMSWACGEIGPNLHILYTPNKIPGACALIKSEYSYKSVYLRHATADEISRLRAQVATGELHFGYHEGIPKWFPLHPEYNPED